MTAKYSGYLRGRDGRAISGGSVAVYDAGTQTLSTLVNELGDEISNPLLSRGDGWYEFYADPEVYDLLIEGQLVKNVVVSGRDLAISTQDYAGTSSYQPASVDLNLASGAGNIGTNPKFLAAFMGNVIGDLMTKAGAYLAGVIGAFSITGARATAYPLGGVVGIVMDGVTDCDAPVVSVIDGSDPSAQTNALAMFKVRMNNNHASSGAQYGVDLYDAGNANYTGGPVALKITKATIRSAKQVCWLEKAGVPTDGGAGDGAGFAEKGSLCTDLTNGDLYINGNTKASPTWKLVTRAA